MGHTIPLGVRSRRLVDLIGKRQTNIETFEIRTNRKFSLSEAIGQIAGGDVMKGGSPSPASGRLEIHMPSHVKIKDPCYTLR